MVDERHNNTMGYKGTGIDNDTAMTVTDYGRTIVNLVPGAQVIKGTADVALAAVQGDIESSKAEEQMLDAGFDMSRNSMKWNPSLVAHQESRQGLWKRRAAQATTGVATTVAGGAAGVGMMTAMGIAGGVAIPIIGAPIGAAIGSIGGGIAGAYVGNKAFNYVAPYDDKDEVDLTMTIVDAQRKGMEIPPQAIFAQWAARQKGEMDRNLKKDLYAATGLTNFNDAIDQGRVEALTSMMNKPEYANAMRADMGMLPDIENPDRHVADQLSDWINSGQLQGKDLLLGKTHMPIMSLQDSQQGYGSDMLVTPDRGLPSRGRSQAPDYSLSV